MTHSAARLLKALEHPKAAPEARAGQERIAQTQKGKETLWTLPTIPAVSQGTYETAGFVVRGRFKALGGAHGFDPARAISP